MVLRQLLAAVARSGALISTWTSFSASAKVDGETSGPTAGPVPNAGGAPGGRSAGFCARLRTSAAAPRKPRDDSAKNLLRDMWPRHRIVAATQQAAETLANSCGTGKG